MCWRVASTFISFCLRRWPWIMWVKSAIAHSRSCGDEISIQLYCYYTCILQMLLYQIKYTKTMERSLARTQTHTHFQSFYYYLVMVIWCVYCLLLLIRTHESETEVCVNAAWRPYYGRRTLHNHRRVMQMVVFKRAITGRKLRRRAYMNLMASR